MVILVTDEYFEEGDFCQEWLQFSTDDDNFTIDFDSIEAFGENTPNVDNIKDYESLFNLLNNTSFVNEEYVKGIVDDYITPNLSSRTDFEEQELNKVDEWEYYTEGQQDLL